LPLAYVPGGAVRVRVKAVGALSTVNSRNRGRDRQMPRGPSSTNTSEGEIECPDLASY